MTENEILKIVSAAALKVYQNLGPSLLESAYQEWLYYEFNETGL